MMQPLFSPWGEIQHCKVLYPHVFSVDTASHGGIMVNARVAKSIFSREALKCAFQEGGFYCFEEDCAETVALRELMDRGLFTAPVNEYWKPGAYEKCINDSVQLYYPDYWQARQNGKTQPAVQAKKSKGGRTIMDMTLRPMFPAERNYCYSQSQQISMQTGLIGYLRADMGSNGEGFFSTWNDFRADLKSEDFKLEFDDVINELRKDGSFLHDRSTLSSCCHRAPDSSFRNDRSEYGFRVDTEHYSYMMRLNPNRGEYNLYCYCYVRQWLDRHLHYAERGIRFISPDYKEIFRIPDGDKVRITLSTDEKLDRVCRYIDDYHVEVGNNLYHICEFAERMEQCGNTVIPLRSSLPEKCFSVLPSTGELIYLSRGEKGYQPSKVEFTGEEGRSYADHMNQNSGVTKAQEAAMLAGSMFGWDKLAADPKNYDENGIPIPPKQKDRGDAR